MVQLKTLRFLSSQKIKDAETLLKNGRNTGAIYMMGYALEFSLKWKISQTLGFANGFPESKAELMLYVPQLSAFTNLNIGNQLTHISQIRHHKLQDLLVFSGVQYRINVRLMSEWQIVNNWNNGWMVKNSASSKFTVITDNKREAITIAREIAKSKGRELIIHGKDGQYHFQEKLCCLRAPGPPPFLQYTTLHLASSITATKMRSWKEAHCPVTDHS